MLSPQACLLGFPPSSWSPPHQGPCSPIASCNNIQSKQNPPFKPLCGFLLLIGWKAKSSTRFCLVWPFLPPSSLHTPYSPCSLLSSFTRLLPSFRPWFLLLQRHCTFHTLCLEGSSFLLEEALSDLLDWPNLRFRGSLGTFVVQILI